MQPNLPPELVRMVFEHVASDRQPLHPLLFVSKEFLHEASRVLYRHIHVIDGTIKRNRRPLNSAVKRSYYAALVERVSLHSCRLYDYVRSILYAADNLKHLDILDRQIFNIHYILRPDYPFGLVSFTCQLVYPDYQMREFLRSQPTIKTVTFDPPFYVSDIPDDAFENPSYLPPLLPGVENIKCQIPIICSELFKNGNIRRIYLRGEVFRLFNLQPTDASRRVTSFKASRGFELQYVLELFPNVRYLDGEWTSDEVLNLPPSSFKLLNKIRLRKDPNAPVKRGDIDNMFTIFPRLDLVVLSWKGILEEVQGPAMIKIGYLSSEFQRGREEVGRDSHKDKNEWMHW